MTHRIGPSPFGTPRNAASEAPPWQAPSRCGEAAALPQLPAALWAEVLGHLPAREAVRAMRVSRSFYDAAQRPTPWLARIDRLDSPGAHQLVRRPWPQEMRLWAEALTWGVPFGGLAGAFVGMFTGFVAGLVAQSYDPRCQGPRYWLEYCDQASFGFPHGAFGKTMLTTIGLSAFVGVGLTQWEGRMQSWQDEDRSLAELRESVAPDVQRLRDGVPLTHIEARPRIFRLAVQLEHGGRRGLLQRALEAGDVPAMLRVIALPGFDSPLQPQLDAASIEALLVQALRQDNWPALRGLRAGGASLRGGAARAASLPLAEGAMRRALAQGSWQHVECLLELGLTLPQNFRARAVTSGASPTGALGPLTRARLSAALHDALAQHDARGCSGAMYLLGARAAERAVDLALGAALVAGEIAWAKCLHALGARLPAGDEGEPARAALAAHLALAAAREDALEEVALVRLGTPRQI